MAEGEAAEYPVEDEGATAEEEVTIGVIRLAVVTGEGIGAVLEATRPTREGGKSLANRYENSLDKELSFTGYGINHSGFSGHFFTVITHHVSGWKILKSILSDNAVIRR